MYYRKKEAPRHLPEPQSHLCLLREHQASQHTCGHTQDWSRAPPATAVPPSRLPAPHPPPERARPARNFAESTAEAAAASPIARTAIRKTMFRTDSSIARKASSALNSTAIAADPDRQGFEASELLRMPVFKDVSGRSPKLNRGPIVNRRFRGGEIIWREAAAHRRPLAFKPSCCAQFMNFPRART